MDCFVSQKEISSGITSLELQNLNSTHPLFATHVPLLLHFSVKTFWLFSSHSSWSSRSSTDRAAAEQGMGWKPQHPFSNMIHETLNIAPFKFVFAAALCTHTSRCTRMPYKACCNTWIWYFSMCFWYVIPSAVKFISKYWVFPQKIHKYKMLVPSQSPSSVPVHTTHPHT